MVVFKKVYTLSQYLLSRKEKKMQYSVRSAYGFCVKDLLEVILGNYFQVEGRHDLIWRREILSKVNSLIWRICHNCLPTRTWLHDKGVNCPQNCSHTKISLQCCNVWIRTIWIIWQQRNNKIRNKYWSWNASCIVYEQAVALLLTLSIYQHKFVILFGRTFGISLWQFS